jgi:hypothetical protein
MFEQIAKDLFQKWALRRAPGKRWVDVATPVRALAAAIVTGEDGTVERDAVEQLLKQCARDREREVVHAVEHEFGLLVRTSDGRLEFALRAIGEFLAAEHWCDRPVEELARMSSQGWAEEPLRHVIGLSSSSRAHELLAALTERARQGELRPLLVAMRAAADLDEVQDPVRSVLFGTCAEYLLDETSVWRGDRVADALVEVARVAGIKFAPLFEGVLVVVKGVRGARAAWAASQKDDDPIAWINRVWERDEGVRAVALERLGLWADDPRVRTILEACLWDEGHDIPRQPPAVSAGLALRRASRTPAIEPLLDYLREMLQLGWQLPGAAASVALRPGEADPASLVRALREGAGGFPMPEEAVRELASTEAGSVALEAGWPEWRKHLERPSRRYTPSDDWSCSQPVHARLTRVALPWARQFALPEVQNFTFANVSDIWNIAAEIAWDDPSFATQLLKRRLLAPLRAVVQRRLGLAALRHRDLGDALLELASDASQHELQLYPGYAIEAL